MAQVTIQQIFDLATQHHQAGRLPQAEQLYRQVLALRPDHADAMYLLGVVAHQMGHGDLAVDLIHRAIALRPNSPQAHTNLGNVLVDRGQLDQAIAAFRQAIALKPDMPEAHGNLGVALRKTGRLDEAIAAFRQAIALRPNHAQTHYNLAAALKDLGELDGAAAASRRAIELKADFAMAHLNYAFVLLMRGEYEEGWKEFEWRMRVPQVRQARDLPQPRWTGQNPAGKTILIFTEGGFGDSLQFIRYAPLVAARGATVLLECQAELAPLLKRVRGISAVFVRDQPLPAFDWQTPLQSLPLTFGTTVETIPADVPYLSAPPERIERWAKRLAGDSSLKVGLAWAGSTVRGSRSCPLATLAPLAAIEGVAFYGLQKRPAADQPVPQGLRLTRLGHELGDFADTAAVVSNLDLVISVDTSVAHLAGGMGKPVWTLIPFVCDFPWLRDRLHSPWYPTMRFFRQSSRGDWNGVITRVAEALSVAKD
jgi:Flp pilus assembly protein TadD